MKIRLYPQAEKAPGVAVDLARVRKPSYGRMLEGFRDGDVYAHPRGLSITVGMVQLFATSFHDANPLHLNQEYAKALGHPACPASGQLVFNVVLSLGVQNDSEKAIANLGYYDAHFLRPVYPGDTLRAMTKILQVKHRDKNPGIVSLRTVGLNQRDELVLQYDRKILVAIGNQKEAAAAIAAAADAPTNRPTVALGFPEIGGAPSIELPEPKKAARNLTGPRSWFEDFKPGDILVHGNGRTITDEHIPWTFRVGNTHPLHYDRLYSQSQKGAMSGEPIVYGGLVFAWLEGIASRDTTENSLATLGFTEGYHTQPAITGDTLTAISRVLEVSPLGKAAKAGPADLKQISGVAVPDLPIDAGIVTFQLIGLKNIRAEAALDKLGAALFEKELKKDKKIPEKVFEIERRVLIRSRG